MKTSIRSTTKLIHPPTQFVWLASAQFDDVRLKGELDKMKKIFSNQNNTSSSSYDSQDTAMSDELLTPAASPLPPPSPAHSHAHSTVDDLQSAHSAALAIKDLGIPAFLKSVASRKKAAAATIAATQDISKRKKISVGESTRQGFVMGASGNEISVYERERELKIEANKAKLRELGLETTVETPPISFGDGEWLNCVCGGDHVLAEEMVDETQEENVGEVFWIECGRCTNWHLVGEDCVGFDHSQGTKKVWMCPKCVVNDM